MAFSPLGDQSGKSKTTRAMNKYVMVAVLLVCLSYLRLTRVAKALMEVDKSQEALIEWTNAWTVPVDYFKGTEYCPFKSIPKASKPFEWAYFQKLIKVNEELAIAARPFSANRQLIVSSEPRIPHRLIFTHQYNLFDCESSRDHLTPALHMLAANARQTVALYREYWREPEAEVVFLSNKDCLQLLSKTEPLLIVFFLKEEGMFKADICRVAELYQNGGYYFDVDLLAIHPVSPAVSVGFASVRGTGWPNGGFFQAFTASAPGHPIVKKSLDILLELYEGKRNRKNGWLGPITMQMAYEQYLSETSPDVVSWDLLLLDEVHISSARGKTSPKFLSTLPQQYPYPEPFVRSIVCNYVVYDESTQYFFSRVNGTDYCGHRPDGFPEDNLRLILPQPVLLP
jgi:hypothetical protein